MNYLKVACQVQAKKKEQTRHNHVAFIFKSKQLVAIGYNRSKTHPAIRKYDYEGHCRIHAELDAVLKYGRSCKNHTLVVVRIMANGNFGQSQPCQGCKHLIKQLGFKKVLYSVENGDLIRLF